VRNLPSTLEPYAARLSAAARSVLRERAGRESPERRMAWAAVAMLLVVGPVIFNLGRSDSFTASVDMYPRQVGPYPPDHGVRYYRDLLADPRLRTETRRNARTVPDYQAVSIRPNPALGSLVLTVRDREPERARRIVNALGPQIASASARHLAAHSERELRRLRAMLRRGPTRRVDRLFLRQAIQVRRGIGPESHRIVIGPRAGPPKFQSLPDRVANAMPGDLKPPPSTVAVALSGLVVVATLWLMGLTLFPPAVPTGAADRGRAPAWRRVLAWRPGVPAVPPVLDPARAALTIRGALVGALVLVLAGAFVLWMGRDMNFLEDDWAFIIGRRGGELDTYLNPHNEHLMLVPTLVFKALFAVEGIGDYWPYRLVVVVAHLGCVVLVFDMARRRIGALAAGLLSAPILAFGPGWEVLLFGINIGFVGSTLAGLGMLAAMDRRTRTGDLVACLLLAVSLACTTLGLCFAAGAAVEVLWRDDRWRRAWIIAAPLLVYGGWYLAYNLDTTRVGPLWVNAPEFAIRAASGALSALYALPLGIETTGRGYHGLLELLSVIALLAGAVAIFRRARRAGVTPRLAMLVTTLGAYWVLTGIARGYSGQWYAGRYVYPGAVLILVLVAEAARGMTLPRRAAFVAVPLAAAIAVANAGWLVKNGNGRRADAQILSAQLAAVEIARDHIPPEFRIDDRRTSFATAHDYFAAADDLGSPALPLSELDEAVPVARRAADEMMIRTSVRAVTPAPGARRPRITARISGSARAFTRRGGRCVAVRAPRRTPVVAIMDLPPSGIGILAADPGSVRVGVRRYGRPYLPFPEFRRAVHERQLLLANLGRSSRPWSVRVSARGPFSIC
jgi:hypothetical protein